MNYTITKQRRSIRFKDVLLKNGCYIEVSSKGFRTGMKIRRENKEDMEAAFMFYSRSKAVIQLGEFKDGVPQKKLQEK